MRKYTIFVPSICWLLRVNGNHKLRSQNPSMDGQLECKIWCDMLFRRNQHWFLVIKIDQIADKIMPYHYLIPEYTSRRLEEKTRILPMCGTRAACQMHNIHVKRADKLIFFSMKNCGSQIPFSARARSLPVSETRRTILFNEFSFFAYLSVLASVIRFSGRA